MNEKLLAVVREMLKTKGEKYLDKPAQVGGFISDIAQSEPKAERWVFVRCLKKKFHTELKTASSKDDRANRKIKLANRLYSEEGIDEKIRTDTLDLLEAALFGDQGTIPFPVHQPLLSNFVLIKGGTFMMGSPLTEPERKNDEIEHKVTVSSFYMGKDAVTQEEYESVMGNNPSCFKGDNLPVEKVSWYDAVSYCNKRSRKDGLPQAYTINGTEVIWHKNESGYRLPTEAEWEYAARAETTTPFNTGNNITLEQANYDGTSPFNGNIKGIYRGKTMAVERFKANSWGLYNMHGNIWEWCWDRYGDYNVEAQINPLGVVSGTKRVIRGGSWSGGAHFLRSAYRGSSIPSNRDNDIGFRLVRNIPKIKIKGHAVTEINF